MILPIHGEGDRREATVEGGQTIVLRSPHAPSTMLRMVPLPVNGEDL